MIHLKEQQAKQVVEFFISFKNIQIFPFLEHADIWEMTKVFFFSFYISEET